MGYFELLFLGSPIFLFGAFTYYVLGAILIQMEEFKLTVLSSLVYMLTLWYFSGINIIQWVLNSPIEVFYYIVIYLSIGAFYSLIKWKLYLTGLKNFIIQRKALAKEKGLDWYTATVGGVNATDASVREYTNYRAGKLNLVTFSKMKGLIVSWVAYWPLSIGGLVINGFTLNVVKYVASLFEGIYNRISKNALSGLD